MRSNELNIEACVPTKHGSLKRPALAFSNHEASPNTYFIRAYDQRSWGCCKSGKTFYLRKHYQNFSGTGNGEFKLEDGS
ncbi:hypothetical protein LINPERPRIM_LOCUS4161 [Linum perenne]